MMVQENPQFPYEVIFSFNNMVGTDNEGETYSEIFWAESADDARASVMAGTTADIIRIVEIKEKKS